METNKRKEKEKKEKKERSSSVYVCGLGRWGRLGLGKCLFIFFFFEIFDLNYRAPSKVLLYGLMFVGDETKTRHHMVPMKSMRNKHVIKTACGIVIIIIIIAMISIFV